MDYYYYYYYYYLLFIDTANARISTRGARCPKKVADRGSGSTDFVFRSSEPKKTLSSIPNKLRLWQKYNVSLKRNNFFM